MAAVGKVARSEVWAEAPADKRAQLVRAALGRPVKAEMAREVAVSPALSAERAPVVAR